MMYKLLKPLLFSMSPEQAHHFTMKSFRLLNNVPGLASLIAGNPKESDPKEKINLLGLPFPNRLGLAAGFDKDGRYLDVLPKLGFGFIELGTVTPRPQLGNPKPRLFRLPKDEALINRMGFNNEGVETLVKRLSTSRLPDGLILGANIGKNKDTPNDLAWQDYLYAFDRLHPWVHYFVVNVSSPNTPGLRELQEKEPLTKLLMALQNKNNALIKPKPILLKIAPDLEISTLEEIAAVVKDTDLQGVILTNTTISRTGLKTTQAELNEIGSGGLSGKPLAARSIQVLKHIRALLPLPFVIVNVGGIDSVISAKERLMAGADLLQIYTGMIYHGPDLIRKILASENN